MLDLHPHYITDQDGEKVAAVIPINEFKSLVEELEDLEDVRLYDEAKKEDDGERISFSDYLKFRKKTDA